MGCTRSSDIENADLVLTKEPPEQALRVIRPALPPEVQHGLALLARQIKGLPGAAREHRLDREDDRPVAVPDVPTLGALGVVGRGGLLELVARVDGTVLGQAAFGAPPTVRDVVGDCPVQRSTVGPGLAAR